MSIDEAREALDRQWNTHIGGLFGRASDITAAIEALIDAKLSPAPAGAVLARALSSHGRGHWFNPSIAHHINQSLSLCEPMWATALWFCSRIGGNLVCCKKSVDNLWLVRNLCTGLLEIVGLPMTEYSRSP